MLRPTKYTDLNLSLLNVSANVIVEIKQEKSLSYDELLSRLIKNIGDGVRYVFIDSLVILYALGFLDYEEKLDAFYLVEHQNEVK